MKGSEKKVRAGNEAKGRVDLQLPSTKGQSQHVDVFALLSADSYIFQFGRNVSGAQPLQLQS